MLDYITFILLTNNKEKNIIPLIEEILFLKNKYIKEIIVIDSNPNNTNQILMREFSKFERKLRLINGVGWYELSSTICEVCLNTNGEIIAVMDFDGQPEVKSVFESIDYLLKSKNDLIICSRFARVSSIKSFSKKRIKDSSFANYFARFTLSTNYAHLSDFMSGCCAFKRKKCIKYLKKFDVIGFKFLYELLSISRGELKVGEMPLNFQSRECGNAKLDYAFIWDFFISAFHSLTRRLISKRAISFGVVGATGVLVHLFVVYFLLAITKLTFVQVIPIAGISAASSNFLINNFLTFRNARLRGFKLIRGLIKFLMVSSVPLLANVVLAGSFYQFVIPNKFISSMVGIIFVFIWNYAASSKFVWKE